MADTSTVIPALPASHRDLLEAPGVGALATIGADGRPQLTAVWYLLDDDGLVKLTVKSHRQKIRNLIERPTATFLVIDPANPVRTIEIRARVEITPDPDYAFAQRVGWKYGRDLRSFDEPTDRRLVVALHPDRVNSKD